MEKQFIPLKDACEYSNKSMSTLRRLVNELKDNQPNKLKYEDLKNGSKKILIEVEYLNECYNLNKDNQPNNTNHSAETSKSIDKSNDNAIIQVYENVIKMLNNDLEAKNKQIDALIERQRESNILVDKLSSKIALETKEVNEVRRKWWQRNK
jgi:hypothetical protein